MQFLAGVDPRGHGEAVERNRRTKPSKGRSPRARGSRRIGDAGHEDEGSIPAGTGKPALRHAAYELEGVDPRGHGEAAAGWTDSSSDPGRSPRARGSQDRLAGGDAGGGSIPAGTGKPSPPISIARLAGVDPRGHGEAERKRSGAPRIAGRSPRARGSPSILLQLRPLARSIPAGTGKPRHQGIHVRHEGVDPRGHGEAVLAAIRAHRYTGRSPRARGSLERPDCGASGAGSIPAGTGKPGRGSIVNQV